MAALVGDTGRRAARVRVVDDTRPGRDREGLLPQTRKGRRVYSAGNSGAVLMSEPLAKCSSLAT